MTECEQLARDVLIGTRVYMYVCGQWRPPSVGWERRAGPTGGQWTKSSLKWLNLICMQNNSLLSSNTLLWSTQPGFSSRSPPFLSLLFFSCPSLLIPFLLNIFPLNRTFLKYVPSLDTITLEGGIHSVYSSLDNILSKCSRLWLWQSIFRHIPEGWEWLRNCSSSFGSETSSCLCILPVRLPVYLSHVLFTGVIHYVVCMLLQTIVPVCTHVYTWGCSGLY